MNRDKTNALLIVYGEGGHQTEMSALLRSMPDILRSENDIIAFTEGAASGIEGVRQIHYSIPLRCKEKKTNIISVMKRFAFNIHKVNSVYKNNCVKSVLSTGPGVAVPVSILARIRGIKVIHVETCCRFYSASWTAKFMYYLATHFYVQNEELLTVFPKATWCGRL